MNFASVNAEYGCVTAAVLHNTRRQTEKKKKKKTRDTNKNVLSSMQTNRFPLVYPRRLVLLRINSGLPVTRVSICVAHDVHIIHRFIDLSFSTLQKKKRRWQQKRFGKSKSDRSRHLNRSSETKSRLDVRTALVFLWSCTAGGGHGNRSEPTRTRPTNPN